LDTPAAWLKARKTKEDRMAVAARKPNVLSDEAQHVINSLEAHFNAVLQAAKSGSPGLIEDVKAGWERILGALDGYGVQLAQPGSAVKAKLDKLGKPDELTLDPATGKPFAKVNPVTGKPVVNPETGVPFVAGDIDPATGEAIPEVVVTARRGVGSPQRPADTDYAPPSSAARDVGRTPAPKSAT
jgi:hypothetical protein